MKAAVINSFGSSDVFSIEQDMPLPEIHDNHILVKVQASSVNPLDWKTRNGDLKMVLGKKFPMILGNDVSGIVVKCGDNVKNLKTGDQVYGMVDTNVKPSWFGFAGTGAYAEYVCAREDTVSLKPHSVTFEAAAAVPLCALTAYQALVKKLKIKKGDSVLINGASGGVGVFAVQIAKAYGATVTAIAGERNKELLFELGADTFYDYKKTAMSDIDQTFDIVYDVVANASYKETKHLLTPNGVYISNIPSPIAAIIPWLRNTKKAKKKTFAWVMPNSSDLAVIATMIDEGKIKIVVDSVYSLENISAAHHHSETKSVTGKIVVKVSDDESNAM